MRRVCSALYWICREDPPSQRRGEAACSPRPGAPASDVSPSSRAALRFYLSKTVSGANGGEPPDSAGPACRGKHPFQPAQGGRGYRSPRPGAPASDASPSNGAALRFCLSKTASGANGGEPPNSAGPACRRKHPFQSAQRAGKSVLSSRSRGGRELLPSAGRSCIRQPTQQRGCKAVLLMQNCAHCAQSFAAKQRRPSVPEKASFSAGAGGKRLAPLGRALLHPTSHPAAGLQSGFAYAKLRTLCAELCCQTAQAQRAGESIPSSRRRGEAACSPQPGAPASDAPPSSGAAKRFCYKTAHIVRRALLPNSNKGAVRLYCWGPATGCSPMGMTLI